MKRKIAIRLLAYFAGALVLFALVSSLLFRSLFTRTVTDAKRTEMLHRAAALSGMLSDALQESRPGGMRSGGPGSNYTAFVRLLSQSDPNMWVLDEHLAFLSSGRMMGRTLEYGTLPPDAERLVKAVFDGHTSISQGFSELAGVPTFTVGAPIYQGGQVVGALLLNDAVSGVDAAIADGQRMLLFSAGAALLLSLVLAARLSLTFTRPIARMQHTAGHLAQGDYTAKTQIARQDEIGQLARSIDTLSDRLLLAQQDSQRQEQLRKDFFANVSHELRTPVTVLRAMLEGMRDGVIPSDQGSKEEHIRHMLAETQGLQRLVDDLMELARLQNPDFPIERAQLSMLDVVRDALRSAERLAQPADIQVERHLKDDPCPMAGDYARLRQMLLIVLDNAIKFSPAGGTVRVTLDRHTITVADQGPGIPAQDLAYIFDRFHKSAAGMAQKGSGLGLAIAKGIADRHGMQITVDSSPGAGTTVRFSWQQST